jgi:hypothetical protein
MAPSIEEDVVAAIRAADLALRVVECPPLSREDLAEISSVVLRGIPSAAVLDAVSRESEMLSGRIVETLRAWLAGGRIVITEAGLDLWEESVAPDSLLPVGPRFRQLLEQLEPDELHMCELLSVADRAVSTADVDAVIAPDRRADDVRLPTREVLDSLVDRGLLEEDLEVATFRFREPRMMTAVAAWMRPSVRSRLRRLWEEATVVAPRTQGRRSTDRGDPDRRQTPRGRRATD